MLNRVSSHTHVTITKSLSQCLYTDCRLSYAPLVKKLRHSEKMISTWKPGKWVGERMCESARLHWEEKVCSSWDDSFALSDELVANAVCWVLRSWNMSSSNEVLISLTAMMVNNWFSYQDLYRWTRSGHFDVLSDMFTLHRPSHHHHHARIKNGSMLYCTPSFIVLRNNERCRTWDMKRVCLSELLLLLW